MLTVKIIVKENKAHEGKISFSHFNVLKSQAFAKFKLLDEELQMSPFPFGRSGQS